MSTSQDNAVELLRMRREAERKNKRAGEAATSETLLTPATTDARADGEPNLEWKQFSTMLPKGLVKALRAAAVDQDEEIREIVRRAIERELNASRHHDDVTT